MNDAAEAARKRRRHRNERIAAVAFILVAAALTLVLVRVADRVRKEAERDTRYIPRPAVVTPEIALLRTYVRIDTSTPAGIAAGARFLASELHKRGVEAEVIESTPGYLNVYARIRGKERGNALLLFNHIDVVAPGEGWSQPPFEGKIVFNELYGRGALDMKGLAICQLLAFANASRRGEQPLHDLVFLATAEEEHGSENGMRWLLEHRPHLFEGVAFAITEGGLAETMNERMTYFGIEVGGKQLVDVRVDAGDEEALRRLRFHLEPYIARRTPDRVLPGVRHFFHDVAPTRISFGQYLADIDATIARGEFWRLPDTYREFAQNVMRVTAPWRNGERWSMRVAMLNLPDVDADERIAWLRREIAPFGVEIGDVMSRQGPVPLSSSETPLFGLLAGQATRQYGVRAGTQVLYRSITDCRFLRTKGVTCYGVSPYPVNIFQAKSMHRSDERIRLDWFQEGVTYTDRVVSAWAAAPGH
jgi:acetylornithine deacetylase/succinyl-diaminopimelate desuccinylase-like protein